VAGTGQRRGRARVSTLAVALGAAAAALVGTPLSMVLSRRTGIVDRPGPLKVHSASVPYLGGVAVFAGVAVGAAVGRPVVLLPLGTALVLGVADDRTGLSPWLRLAGQIAVGVAVAATVATRLPHVVGPLLVVAVTVLLVNGVNFLDGLDALAGGVAAVAAAGFAVLLRGGGRDIGVALGCALVGFLVYNRPPARIYLGDGGSYLLGTTLAVLLASAWAPGVRASAGVAGLVVVAVPVAEVAFAVVRRRRGGVSLVAGDRGHPYDRLVARGWSRFAASLAYVAVEVVLVGVGLAVRTSTGLALPVATAGAVGAVLLGAGAVVGGLKPDEA